MTPCFNANFHALKMQHTQKWKQALGLHPFALFLVCHNTNCKDNTKPPGVFLNSIVLIYQSRRPCGCW